MRSLFASSLLSLALLHVLLERRSLGDGLARVLVLERLGVAGVGHAASALLALLSFHHSILSKVEKTRKE